METRTRAGEAATVLATELAVQFQCDRVTIGLRQGHSIRLIALSHQSLDSQKQTLHELIAAVMEEAALQRATVTVPDAAVRSSRIVLAHVELSTKFGSEAICTVPLANNGDVYGAIVFERGAAHPFAPSEATFFEHVAALLGPVLSLQWRMDMPWWRLIAARLSARESRWSKTSVRVGAAVSVLTLAGLCLLPIDYRVSAPARLEGSTQRSLAAPVDGYIKQVHVRAGDVVKAGQVLAELSEEEFALEHQRRESEVVQLQSALGDALAKHDYSQIGVLSAKIHEATARLNLVAEQLQRTKIRAPFDAVVITGDLTRSIGSPVRQGDTLLVVSPSQGHRVILDVDEADIVDIAPGRQGILTLTAYPARPVSFKVERITPMASTKETRNFFEVEATLAEQVSDLRPGLQGVAKVNVGRRSLLWVLGHDAWDWLRIALWSWSG